MNSPPRRAVSLVEVLIALAILAILLALLLPAVQTVRVYAQRIQTSNDIRQVVLASHHYASAHGERWPSVDADPASIAPVSVVGALCSYLEATAEHPPPLIRFRSDPSRSVPLSPPTTVLAQYSDGTPARTVDTQSLLTSLAFNPLVYARGKRTSSVTDGTSATIAVTEHYGVCGDMQFKWEAMQKTCYDFPSFQKIPCPVSFNHEHRASFADMPMFDDVVPVTTNSGSGPVTVGSLPLTFQVRPPVAECDPRIPQSSLPGGILCGFADGSVRFVGQNVSAAAFWGSVTPDRGEVVSLD